MKKNNILIATGGTGGHIFPATALKERLQDEGLKVTLTADARFSRFYKFDETNILIPAKGFNSKSIKNVFITLLTLMHGFIKALYLIYKIKPDLVIGFGGYATYPTMLAAIIFRKEIILHEANVVIGKVNRMLLPYAKYLTTGFESINGVKEKYRNKIIYTGNPVRSKIINAKSTKINDKLVILIIGGSGGAKIFSNIIPSMIINLPAEIKNKLSIYQQVKEEDIEKLKEIYSKEGIECEINSFFTDMDIKLSKSNLVIARAGASTIAELIELAVPAILIPLPSSADNHQYYNAKAMADKKASWLIIEEQNAASNLLKLVKSIGKDQSILKESIKQLENMRTYACKNIIEVITQK